MKIKVCGMRDKENIESLIALKPDFMGFIFYDKSKRFVTDFPKVKIPSAIKKVGVFVNESIEFPDIAIATEVLEHLVDPDAFIKRLLDNGVKYIIASSPDYETPSYHAPFHLWVFNGDSYKEMFIASGWDVTLHHKDYFQYIIAKGK